RLASLDDLLGLSGYASSAATIRLDSFASPHLWDLLAQASDLGIPLVSTDKQIAVHLADAASFHIDVTRSEPAGPQSPLLVAPEVMIDDRSVPSTTDRPIGLTGVYSLTMTGKSKAAITLAPLSAPLTPAQKTMLGPTSATEIPVEGQDEFFQRILPLLRTPTGHGTRTSSRREHRPGPAVRPPDTGAEDNARPHPAYGHPRRRPERILTSHLTSPAHPDRPRNANFHPTRTPARHRRSNRFRPDRPGPDRDDHQQRRLGRAARYLRTPPQPPHHLRDRPEQEPTEVEPADHCAPRLVVDLLLTTAHLPADRPRLRIHRPPGRTRPEIRADDAGRSARNRRRRGPHSVGDADRHRRRHLRDPDAAADRRTRLHRRHDRRQRRGPGVPGARRRSLNHDAHRGQRRLRLVRPGHRCDDRRPRD